MSYKDVRIAIVISHFNTDITESLLKGAQECASKEGLEKDQLQIYWVPGAFELPIIAKKLAQSLQYDAVVCLGAVLKGETEHFDYVSSAAAHGIVQASLETNLPILFGVLTCDRSQALVRSKGERNKGFHTFKAALDMVGVCNSIESKTQNLLH
ncbi:MAG: 6,7-dimethyl-8-ribityllumazine synthase [Chlamydiae bacterium]|nr:6,7-dimethyl-8-ribityllumazine synthase [Chlamydiota bacterium]